MRPRHLAAAAALAGALLLAGCLPGLPVPDAIVDEIRGIEGGECYAVLAGGGMDFDRPLPCTQGHTFEVLAAFPPPERFADAAFDEVVDEDGRLLQELYVYGTKQCAPALAQWSGLSATLGKVPAFAGELSLEPGITGQFGVTTTPANVWAGYPALLCIVQWLGTDLQATEVASRSAEPALRSFAAPDTPTELRVCQNAGSQGDYRYVDCGIPHTAEALFTFDAAKMFGPEWVAGIDLYALTKKDLREMDAACGVAGPAIFGAQRTLTDVAILAEVFDGTWGTDDSAGTYPIACAAVPTDPAMLLDGPVWGLGDEPAALVPAG